RAESGRDDENTNQRKADPARSACAGGVGGERLGRRGGGAHTCITSCRLCSVASSIFPSYCLVSSWICSLAPVASSSVITLPFSSVSTSLLASRRALRTEILACSANCLHWPASWMRRSWLIGGSI